MTTTTSSSVTLLSEDEIYRTSSQYRLWSFSPEKLAAQRKKTHELAIERIATQPTDGSTEHGQYLSEEQELRLVQRYCEQIRATNDHFKWPVNVKYLRRFYLSNSVMTYPPKEIYKTALFLACKTEATHMTLSEYARRISSKPEEILAPEYKLMQALRFTLDVRQPFRGLKGVLMELLNMVEGLPQPSLKDALLALSGPSDGSATAWTMPRVGATEAKHIQDRVQAAYAASRTILDNQALMTDVYFLYTPAQILHAAMYRADPELTDFYISTKLSAAEPARPRIMAAIQSCAEILGAFDKSSVLTKDERAELEAKLERCRDASTRDMVEHHLAKKIGDGLEDEDKARRRQAERERSEKEGHDLFGPSLMSNGTNVSKG
ncbi:hypothetical protein AMS68_004967 [Peltaster fructicola]|uniref:RNA polymerase II holoenzyme cyclin-like subunit n=1 Tax=Peltaster fructicola TaxID=286661 RepID=A0A6H0XYF9_9PEZI|nr:hypothetical protein AMS68_004967 [Peltaster fructicola]